MDEIVKRVRTAAGGPSRVARMVGVSRSAVSQWSRIPIEHVLAIEAATGIPREELRPDVYTKGRRRRRTYPLRRAGDVIDAGPVLHIPE